MSLKLTVFSMNVKRIMDMIMSSGLNKSEIASKMKTSRTTLDNLLNGADVKVSTIENLAEVLGVNVAEFFGSGPKSKPAIAPPTPPKNMEELEKENIALKAENNLLRELQGLGEKSQKSVG